MGATLAWGSQGLQHASESDEVSPFQMNLGAVFSEDDEANQKLEESVSALIGALLGGEIPDDLVAAEDQGEHSFFFKALRGLGAGESGPMPLVLKSFSPDGGESYLITIAFMREQGEGVGIHKIIEFHAYPDGVSGFRFRSPFAYRTRAMQTREVGGVRFSFEGMFDEARAEAFGKFKREFERQTGGPAIELDYYRFETLDELLGAYGVRYDCTKCNWLKEDLGFMDGGGRCFVTGTGNERYIFAYLVDYMSSYCDDDGDLYPPFVYGMGAYYGGYGLTGEDVDTLKAQFRAEMAANPEIDFLAEFKKGRGASVNRHFSHYVMSAFLCEAVLERHGFDAVMRLARSGRSGERFFDELEDLLGVDEQGFHGLVQRLIRNEDA